MHSASEIHCQWIQTNGPYGAEIRGLITNGQNLFAGTNYHGIYRPTHGVYRSTDNGSSWSTVNTGLPDTTISLLTQIGSSLFAVNGKGLFATTNNGSSWSVVDTSGPLKYTNCLSNIGESIFAGASAVYKSTDGGQTWSLSSDGLPVKGTISSMIAVGKNLLASEKGGGIYLSTNNGRNWKYINQGMTNYTIHSFLVNGSNVFAGTDSNVYISTNSGNSWDFASGGLPERVYVNALTSIGSLLFCGTDSTGLYISSDSGTNWNPITSLRELQILTLSVNGSDLYAGTPAGLFHSADNGKTWSSINNGLLGNRFINISGSGEKLYAVSDVGSVFSTIDGGRNWIEADSNLPSGAINGFSANGDNLLALFNHNNQLYASTNSGMAWTEIDNKLPRFSIYSHIKVLDVAVMGNNFVIATDSGLYRSPDKGVSWNQVSSYSFSLSNTLAKNRTNLYAWSTRYLLASSDSGKMWMILDSASVGYGYYRLYRGFTIDDNNVITIFQDSSHRDVDVLKFGNKYSQTGWLNSPQAVAPDDIGTFASSSNGLFLYLDSLSSWVLVDSTMKNDPSLFIVESILYAGTSNNGIWKRNVQDFNANVGIMKVLTSLDFNDTLVGDTECRVIELGNIGNAPFSVLSTFFSYAYNNDTTAFYIDKNQFPIQIKPKDSVGVKICFIPKAKTEYFGVLQWNTDVIGEKSLSNFSTQLDGTGVLTLKVNEFSDKNNITISPNPTLRSITVYNAPENLSNISIFNILGEKVLEIPKPNPPGFEIDISKLPAGMYYARFVAGGSVFTQKIIKE